MTLADAPIRIDYFLGSSSGYLRHMGIDPNLLPTRARWLEKYAADFARPTGAREARGLILELDSQIVGFSSLGYVEDRASALIHFHLTDPSLRGRGLGTRFLVLCTQSYFAGVKEFTHLYGEPNAFNIPPNRMLQNAGFHYLYTHLTTPGPIHLRDQPMTRWVIHRQEVLSA
jgi:RimJ/RimL family protein N-acetyltransferase